MARGKGGAAPGDSERAALEAAVAALCQRLDGHLTPAQLGQELVRPRHLCDRLELEFSVLAARFAATDECEVQGSVSSIDCIRHSCRMSGHAAASSPSGPTSAWQRDGFVPEDAQRLSRQ